MFNDLQSITQMHSIDEGTPSAGMMREQRSIMRSSGQKAFGQAFLMNIEEEADQAPFVCDFNERLREAEQDEEKADP